LNRLYYLIATLPEFDPLDSKTPLDSESLVEIILNNTYEDDHRKVRMMLVMNDIRNLIMYFTSKHGKYTGNKLPFSPSLMEYQQIDEWQLQKSVWPDFLVKLMEDHQAEFVNLNETEITRFFWSAYYDALEKEDPYLREVMQNYIIMHDLLGLIRSKNLDLGLWDHWIGYEEQLEDLKSGRLTLSGMAQEHENFNNLKTKSLETEPGEAESWCDDLLIRKSGALLGHMPFDIEHLLHYTFRLIIGAKWREMQKENGRQRFDVLKEELIKEIQIPSVI
jgi:hypothetical protein